MRKIFLMLCLACSCATMCYSQEVKKKVAVYVSGDVQAAYKKVIGAKIVSGVTTSADYVAVERTNDFLAALQQEHDYQASGAVSDHQIVKLGERFGVRYVLVADVSELFGSIFVSARMINVQTGLILASAEVSKEVEAISQLVALSSEVVTDIMEAIDIPTWDIKALGPFVTLGSLFDREIPEGYRIITEKELETLIKHNKVSYPIYLDIVHAPGELIGSGDNRYWYHSVTYKLYDSATSKKADTKAFKYWGGYVTNPAIPSGFVYVIKK